MDIQRVVDPCDWPDVDSQPLSMEDPWRLRVASAQAFCIVKNRDTENFERVLKFLEAAYRLLPRLVAPIKHMKMVFGLKTLVIMHMLRQRRGMIDTVLKITQFFPNQLPQYQGHCNQHEMFLMRKNNLDFKLLAQTLAMDEDKWDSYVQKHMEQHYGGHYAQRVEDRLLQYLQELEAALPGDTFIDRIMKKKSPVTEEEKLLLDVVTSDSTTTAVTLRKLLHCDAASCRPAVVPRASERGATEAGNSALTKSVVCISSSNTSVEDKTPLEAEMLMDSEQETSPRASGAAPSPQFCSKHQRWVKSILQECPDECSEDMQVQANASSPPSLFQLSSSISSSQDLTPSDLVPCSPGRQLTPPQPAACPPPASEWSSGSARDGSLPQCSSRDAPLSPLLSPVVRLVDITSVGVSCPYLKPHPTSPNTFIVSRNKQPPSTPQARTSPVAHEDSTQHRGAATDSRRPRTLGVAEHLPSSDLGFSSPSERPASVSLSETPTSNRNPSSPRSTRQNNIPLHSQTEPRTAEASSACGALRRQGALLQSYVSLSRLSARECERLTGSRCVESESQGREEEDSNCSFDLNSLYSSRCSSADDSLNSDPDYKPPVGRKTRFLEESD